MTNIQFTYAIKGMKFYGKCDLLTIAKRVIVDGEHIGELAKEYGVHRSSIHRSIAKIKLNFEENCKKDNVVFISSIVPSIKMKDLKEQERKLLEKTK